MIEIIRGNLLEADVEALVNTVNTVGAMGKGLALQFKRAFPANYAAYRQACRRGEVRMGEVFQFDRGVMAEPRWILNFPTKQHWRSRSHVNDVERGLEHLRRLLIENQIRSVAIPPLGCGLGGLQWNEIRPRIEDALADLDARVLIFEPGYSPQPKRMKVSGSKPRLTPFRAAVLKLLAAYGQLGYSTSPLEAQKLTYFLQAAGEDLRLKFRAHLYGPYTHALTKALEDLEGHYLSGLGDQQAARVVFELLPGAAEAAEEALSRAGHGLVGKLERVITLVEGFETPYGLELLASLHWIAHHGLEEHAAAGDLEAAVALLRIWNERKARLFDAHHIRVAWERLDEAGWLLKAVA